MNNSICKEGLYYITDSSVTEVTTEDLQEYYYDLLFTNVDFVRSCNFLNKDIFNNNFLLKNGQLDNFEKIFLYNFVKNINPKKIVEFSCADGHSTTIISKALVDNKISVDYFETHEIEERCVKNTELLLYDNDIDFVKVKLGDVFETLDRKKISDADFIFIDSEHSAPFTNRYVKEFFPLFKKGSWVVIHDIRFHKKHVNDESLIVREYLEKNNINTYFYVADLLKLFGIANDFRPWSKNTMMAFKV